LDDYNKVAVNLEFNKLLVPTPQNPDLDGNGTITPEERRQNLDNYRSIGWVSGVFKSFGDAPGFSEESKEVTYAVGAEYSYRLFAMRMGYFHESPFKAQDNSFP
jgi:hypothetical protein